jgi:AraC family transcriptional regulator
MIMNVAQINENEGFFGQRIAAHFGMPGYTLAEYHIGGQLGLVATHLSCDRRVRERTDPAPFEEAFSILYQFEDLECRSRWLDGRLDGAGRVRANEVDIVDLRARPQWKFEGRFDALQFYIPSGALFTFAGEHCGKPVSALRWKRGIPDQILWGLSIALVQAAACPGANQLLKDQLAIALLIHFAQAYGDLEALPSVQKGKLAVWQERRAKEIMAARLSSNLTIEQVATECRLTPSHFARAFRKSTGLAPQRYLMHLRVAEAKNLLSGQHLSLSDIALTCGFGDQSHFTRIFRQLVGDSPGAWRRRR